MKPFFSSFLLVIVFSSNISCQYKNGFDLSGSSIDSKLILSGGPPRDGIPAINKPVFVPAEQDEFLQPYDRILGVEIDNEAKAYPLRILNWHEIVNDKISGKAIVITYCPLCGTGAAFSARIKGKDTKFGVSGLLYNSDVLLYDRTTNSLWSQIMMKSISGLMKDSILTQIPLFNTTWDDWKNQHPNTYVLSEKTGYSRDYSRDPYQGYATSNQLFSEITNYPPEKFHLKEFVIGLSINGFHKAYPFSELNKTASTQFIDIIGETQIVFHWDSTNQSGWAEDAQGEIISSLQAFWFAWYTFHPGTEVFIAID